MSKDELDLINKIKFYREEIHKTQSKQRQNQLWKHIRKLEKSLKIYRSLRYSKNNI